MRKYLFYSSFIFSLLIFLFSCTQDGPEKSTVLCEINQYKLTLDDFRRQLAEEVELNPDFKLTRKAKQRFLEELIRKELLIQEAKRLKLDTKEKFARAIERYWESTLIRDLMERKAKEISARTCVSEEEIMARYRKMRNTGQTTSSISELHDRIREALQEEKKTRILNEWIDGLRKRADIRINEHLLKSTPE